MKDKYLITGSKDNTIKLYLFENGIFTLIGNYKGHQESLSSLAIAPCTFNQFCSVSSDKSIKLWKLNKKGFQEISNSER